MATFQFELVSPERLLFSGEVEQVDVPGSEGDFGVFAEHAPLIAMLRPGILTIYGNGGTQRIVVKGGFAQVNPDGLTVLADSATAVEDFDRASLAADIEAAQAEAAAAEGHLRDRLEDRVDKLRALQAALGAGAGGPTH